MREYHRKYNQNNKEHISKRKHAYYLKYRDNMLQRQKDYYSKHQDAGISYDRDYSKTEKGKQVHKTAIKKYRQSEKGKISIIKVSTKRKRNLNWILMFDNPFDESEEIEYHHINDAYVVAIPKDLHRQYLGKFHREKTMEIVKQIYLE